MDIKATRDTMHLSRSEDYYIKVLLQEITLDQIMTTKVVSIPVTGAFSQVVRLFNAHHIRHLPVIGADQRLVGLITQRDLFKNHPPKRLDNGEWYYDPDELDRLLLGRVMIPNPFTMQPQDHLGDLIAQMVQHKYGCVPVVNTAGRLQGIITQYDILKMAAAIYLE